MTPLPGIRIVAKDIQKAPYEEKAVAPKTLPRGNSHIPARSCTRPPVKIAMPTTTLGVATPRAWTLISERIKVVDAKEKRPRAPGFAMEFCLAVEG